MCKYRTNLKDKWLIVGIFAFFSALPFVLNWLLLRPAFCKVIGNEETWLSFWATYVGSILTALMVLATFITIRKSTNLALSQRKIDWLHSFREESASLIKTMDINLVHSYLQSIRFGGSSDAVKKGYEIAGRVRRSSFILTSLLKEYDDLFGGKKSVNYIHKLNERLDPFLQQTGEMIQLAIICDYLDNKDREGKLEEGYYAIKSMLNDDLESKYPILVQTLNDNLNNPKDIMIHNIVVRLLEALEQVETQSMEELLITICKTESQRAHSLVLLTFMES